MNTSDATPPAGSRYQDQRVYVAVERLEELSGPSHGEIRLAKHLDWSADPTYDLDDPGDLIVMYQTVLNEAAKPDDLRRFLNAETLRRVWATLWLPPRLRDLWQRQFPELAHNPARFAS